MKDYPETALDITLKRRAELLLNAVEMCKYLEKTVIYPLLHGTGMIGTETVLHKAEGLLRSEPIHEDQHLNSGMQDSVPDEEGNAGTLLDNGKDAASSPTSRENGSASASTSPSHQCTLSMA